MIARSAPPCSHQVRSPTSWWKGVQRLLVGVALGIVARLWVGTLRVRSAVHPALTRHGGAPWILAHWHGQILPLLAHRRRRPTVALVSMSADGDRMSHALRLFDVTPVRGSRSHGGRRGLAAIVEMLVGGGRDAVIAVDGPRGPRRWPKPGALAAARRSSGVVVPYAAHCSRSWLIRGAWDGFEVPVPFSSVGVVLGAPLLLGPGEERADLAVLAEAIGVAQAAAQRVAEGGASQLWRETESA